jgi:undecaprenyl diphosphate synthase
MHVAIIMDGNGRWAGARGLPRRVGHEHGVVRVREIVESAPGLGIDVLTLYAFSGDNWKRPQEEVSTLMALFDRYLSAEARRLVEARIRLNLIGRRDRLPPALARSLDAVERSTASGSRMHLRLAIDYSGREALRRAAQAAAAERPWSAAEFDRRVASGRGAVDEAPDVDLLIRTGGEQRLSDFLLWECAYAELWFTPTAWPDFTGGALRTAVEEFEGRQRRFGALPPARQA